MYFFTLLACPAAFLTGQNSTSGLSLFPPQNPKHLALELLNHGEKRITRNCFDDGSSRGNRVGQPDARAVGMKMSNPISDPRNGSKFPMPKEKRLGFGSLHAIW
jgi:hypothetical protein